MPSLRIASPCSASWEGMRIVEGGRHCETCDKQVHDFTRMTETQALARALLFRGGGLCGRLLLDAEGNTRFRSAPGPRSRRRALPLMAATAAALSAGCASHEPASAEPLATQAVAAPPAATACEPEAKIVEVPTPAPSASAAVAAAPRRVIVTTSGDLHVLRQVTFRSGDATLDAEDVPLLEEVAKLMAQMPDIRKVLVKGHTDEVEARADKLSRARADIVISFLVSRGVQAARLEPRALGAEQPIDATPTPEGRARNRRVEFQIVPEP